MSFPRIAIVGAGPGGLMLARLLQTNSIPCTIFELDEDCHGRDQGGMLDLHPQSGQLAVREAGLLDEFKKLSQPAAENMRLVKKNGEVCWDDNDKIEAGRGSSRDRPEIARSDLRSMLLDSVQPGTIQWNRKLVEVQPVGDKYNLRFANGIEEGFDLVVGADGAWSKVRALLTDQQPVYSSVSMIELRALDVSTKKEWLSKFTGSGTCFMFDEGRVLVCQHNGNDSIRVYAGVRQPESWVKDCGIDWEKEDEAREELAQRYFGDCHEDLKRVIAREASDGLRPWALYMLPVGFKWSSRNGITLLGDAAHLMTPFAGVGVNVALIDAHDLAKALLKRRDNSGLNSVGGLTEAIQEYEIEMFDRAKKYMAKTSQGLEHHFSADGIDQRFKLLRHREKLMEEAARSICQPAAAEG